MAGSPSQPGIIPRVMKVQYQIFQFHVYANTVPQELLNRKQPESDHESLSFSMSYMEIYKDEVYDLLGDRENVSSRL